jgi:toxin ParE1/3/4
MLPVIRTEQAENDLESILTYLDEHSPAAAQRLAKALDERCRLLEQLPMMGRPRDDLAMGLRSVVIEGYVLFYRITTSAVEVIRILHGRRDIDSIMKEQDQA